MNTYFDADAHFQGNPLCQATKQQLNPSSHSVSDFCVMWELSWFLCVCVCVEGVVDDFGFAVALI